MSKNNATNATNKHNETNTTNETNEQAQLELEKAFQQAFQEYQQKEYVVEYLDESNTTPVRLRLNKSIRKDLREKRNLDLKKLAYITYEKAGGVLYNLVKAQLDTLNYREVAKLAKQEEEE